MSGDKKKSSGGHRKSEVNLAIFLFQTSYQGYHPDLKDVINSEKIRKEKRWMALNAHDAEGMPILINCIKGASKKKEETDHLECLKILAQTGIPLDAKDKQGRTALHWSVLAERYELCAFLLKQGAKGYTGDEISGPTPLHYAVSKKLVNFVKLLCGYDSQKQRLDLVDNKNITALHQAVLSNTPLTFECLLGAGANINLQIDHGRTLGSYIIENDLTDFLKIIIKYKVKMTIANHFNVIHLAAHQKNNQSLRLLAACHTLQELQAKDKLGKTPLIYAVYHNAVQNVKILIDAGVDVEATDNEGKTAMHVTAYNSGTKCLDMLVAKCPSLLNRADLQQRYPIHSAISLNNQTIVRAMLDHKADPTVLDNENHSLVHYATEYASVAGLLELVSVGVPVNTADKFGVYPIHYAVNTTPEGVSKEKIAFLKQLVKTDVQLDVVDNQGCRPIHWAVCTGNTEALKILLIEDVDPNAKTVEGLSSSLHLACKFKKLECLQLLVQVPKINVDAVDSLGQSALFNACEVKGSEYTDVLLKAGAACNVQDSTGRTPAHIAVINGSVESLWQLSINKAPLNMKNNAGETPLHLACTLKDDGPLRFLLARNCDVNSRQSNSATPLHVGIIHKNFSCIQLLLNSKANCNILVHGEDVYTPLDLALENGDYTLIKLLRSYGAQTGHCVLSNAAVKIQHCWKMYRKRRNPDLQRVTQNGSLCNSSNASESVSVLEAKRNIQMQQENQQQQEAQSSVVESVVISPPLVPLTTCSDESDQLFKQRIANGNREIDLMRELMRESEQLLLRAKMVNRDAEVLISGNAFRTMKTNTKVILQNNRSPMNRLDE